MKLTHYDIHPRLKEYVAKLWVYESNNILPEADQRIIVPNGLIKLVIPFRNGLRAKIEDRVIISHTHELTVIGISDMPSVVRETESGASGTIGIEFNPGGAYRFFNFPLRDLTNQVIPLVTILGSKANNIQEEIQSLPDVDQKVRLVQQFLLDEFTRRAGDEIFEYCVNKIISSGGRMLISELEKKTGYSSRWLTMKFASRIGISPKNLSSIIRFQEIYRGWASTNFTKFRGSDIYSYYHDQPHFIKSFKRFTGFSPLQYQSISNDFGKIFYKG